MKAAGSTFTKLPLRLSAAVLSNNIVSGRVAMLGFAYALLGEVLDGKGLLAQIGYDTSVDHGGMDGFFLFVVGAAGSCACASSIKQSRACWILKPFLYTPSIMLSASSNGQEISALPI